MRNEPLFNEVMTAPARPLAGEEAPSLQASGKPSFMPKFILVGTALVLASAIISAPLDRYLEQRRVAAEIEKRELAVAEEKRQQMTAELERRAITGAEFAVAARENLWSAIEGFQLYAREHVNPVEREASRRALEAHPVPGDLPKAAPLDLKKAMESDLDGYLKTGKALSVDAGLAAYEGDTKRLAGYVQQLRDARRDALSELGRPVDPHASEALKAKLTAELDQLRQRDIERGLSPLPPIPGVEKPAGRASTMPRFEMPKVRQQQPTQAEKRQVTDW